MPRTGRLRSDLVVPWPPEDAEEQEMYAVLAESVDRFLTDKVDPVRIDREACHIVQPEMGHTGITQFLRIGGYAAKRGLQVIPHATIGSGIWAASLRAASSAASLLPCSAAAAHRKWTLCG